MALAQKQKYGSVEWDRKPKNKPTHLWSINIQQEREEYTTKKRPFLQQLMLGKLYRYLKRKKEKRKNLDYTFTPCTKTSSKWIKDLIVKPETIKLPEENIGSVFFDSLSNVILDMSPQVRETKVKINKWNLYKRKSFCRAKEITDQTK